VYPNSCGNGAACPEPAVQGAPRGRLALGSVELVDAESGPGCVLPATSISRCGKTTIRPASGRQMTSDNGTRWTRAQGALRCLCTLVTLQPCHRVILLGRGAGGRRFSAVQGCRCGPRPRRRAAWLVGPTKERHKKKKNQVGQRGVVVPVDEQVRSRSGRKQKNTDAAGVGQPRRQWLANDGLRSAGQPPGTSPPASRVGGLPRTAPSWSSQSPRQMCATAGAFDPRLPGRA